LGGRKEAQVNRYYEGGWEDKGELRRGREEKGKEEGQHTVQPMRGVN
jgi:hypothetical protein